MMVPADCLRRGSSDEVDRLRSEFDGPARLGNFTPLMSRASDLLDEPRSSLTHLLGHVLSVENAVAEYRKRLVENPELLRARRGLDAIAAATGSGASKTLGLEDLEKAGSLSRALERVNACVHECRVAGDRQLAATGVSFGRWCAVVAALDSGRDPALEPREAEALVERGLVQRTYRLGGRA